MPTTTPTRTVRSNLVNFLDRLSASFDANPNCSLDAPFTTFTEDNPHRANEPTLNDATDLMLVVIYWLEQQSPETRNIFAKVLAPKLLNYIS